MAPKHKWCNDIPAPHKDGEGNRYCIYHAPRGRKGETDHEHFNKLVFREIRRDNKRHGASDMSGTVFEGAIDFKQFYKNYPTSSINFSNAVFSDTADFSGIEFKGDIQFKGARFEGEANFKGATFEKEVKFERAVFEKEADFDGAAFISRAHFFDAVFKGRACFTRVSFGKEVYFSIGAFKDGAYFDKVKYGARAVFKRPYPGIPREP
jgi:uncharacterized protein YjbI with pentapeptide repeats